MVFRRRIFGKTLVVNLNAKRGFRVSPGVNSRARAIQKCAKGQPLEVRKNCFRTGGSSTTAKKKAPPKKRAPLKKKEPKP